MVVAFVIFIILLNVWYRNQRAKMTDEERNEPDRSPGDW
jgi:hypothetical protein